MSKLNRMVGLLGISPTRPFRDNDGDKVPNILDCQPNNPRKQGWIHDQLESYKKNRQERREAKYIETTKAIEAAREERQKQVVETARYKERLRGERQRKYIQGGGIVGQFMGGFHRGGATEKKLISKVKTKPGYRYVKKGKHYVRKKVGVPSVKRAPIQSAQKTFNISDVKLDIPKLF